MAHKTYFAPLPLRAIGDSRLSALELRVLSAIAFHDRMSGPRGKGQGSWASNDKLAQRVGCHYTRVSSAITRLGRLGYVEREAHPLNKRLRVYRVIYSQGDSLPDGKASDSGAPTDDALPTPSAERSMVCDGANHGGSIVCGDLEKHAQFQAGSTVEYISLSDGIDSAEAGEDIQNNLRAAGAPRGVRRVHFRDCEPIHETLAKFEREFRADPRVYGDSLPRWLEWLSEAAEQMLVEDDVASARAQRLSCDVDHYLWECGHYNRLDATGGAA